MQEDYLSDKSKYQFKDKQQLIENINKKVSENTIYIKNSRKGKVSDLVKGLKVKSNLIFVKEKSSSFNNPDFAKYLEQNQITEIEVAGIEGNCCVKSTAIDARKQGIKVTIDLSCVGVLKEERFEKTKEKLKAAGVYLI